MIQVEQSIKNVCQKLIEHPYLIFSEADLQVLLSMELSKYDDTYYKTQLKNSDGQFLKTKLVHREYVCRGIKGKKVDIVVYSKEDITNINDSIKHRIRLGGSKKRYVNLSKLIEIKTNFNGRQKVFSSILDDFEKMRKVYIDQVKSNVIEPELFYLYFIRWNLKNPRIIKRQINNFKPIIKRAKHHPVIKLYLVFWPFNTWKSIFQEDKFLKNYDLNNFRFV